MTGKPQIFNLGQEFYHQLGYLDSNFVVKAHYYGYPWRYFKINWGNIKRKIWLKSKVGVNSLLISTDTCLNWLLWKVCSILIWSRFKKDSCYLYMNKCFMRTNLIGYEFWWCQVIYNCLHWCIHMTWEVYPVNLSGFVSQQWNGDVD